MIAKKTIKNNNCDTVLIFIHYTCTCTWIIKLVNERFFYRTLTHLPKYTCCGTDSAFLDCFP